MSSWSPDHWNAPVVGDMKVRGHWRRFVIDDGGHWRTYYYWRALRVPWLLWAMFS